MTTGFYRCPIKNIVKTINLTSKDIYKILDNGEIHTNRGYYLNEPCILTYSMPPIFNSMKNLLKFENLKFDPII